MFNQEQFLKEAEETLNNYSGKDNLPKDTVGLLSFTKAFKKTDTGSTYVDWVKENIKGYKLEFGTDFTAFRIIKE